MGIDESLNDPLMEKMLQRLFEQRKIAAVVRLWITAYATDSGQRVNVMGSSAKFVEAILGESVRRDRSHSTPDEDIVALLLSYFLSYDRLCLLTADVNRNTVGIWSILHTEVEPVLQELDPVSLGLLALCPRKGSKREDYCAAVEARLAARGPETGFEWAELG